eukprot:258965_1
MPSNATIMKRIFNKKAKPTNHAFDILHNIPTKMIHLRAFKLNCKYSITNNQSSEHRIFQIGKYHQHIGIKRKQITPSLAAKKHKSHIDSLNIKGEHYTDTHCHVCKVSFPSMSQAQQHVSSSKHLKKMLEHHSDFFQNECVYCNIYFDDESSKQNHLFSQQHHTAIQRLIKTLKPSPSPSKSAAKLSVVSDPKHPIHVKGIKDKHYTDTHCHVCDVPFDASNPCNLTSHLNGSKHIKNVLAHYSGEYHNKCVYCNALCDTAESKHAHISSINHSDFINGMIDETRTKYSDHEWVLSLSECQKRIGNVAIRKKSAKSSNPIQMASAARIRKEIRDCYDDDSPSSIDEQLLLLEKLSFRSQLNEKDYISISFCISSLMRTNDTSIISDGFTKICALFADDREWKMNHKLFEQMLDVMLLSANLQHLMREFDELIRYEDTKEAFNCLLGMDAERAFLEPFGFVFEFYCDVTKWESQSFENEKAHQYFMKWTQLIFGDMMYNLRDIRYCQQTDFNRHYRQLIHRYYGSFTAMSFDVHNDSDLRKYCSFTETKRLESGPFINLSMSTPLASTLSSFSKGSFAVLVPQDTDSKQVLVGYIYRVSATSQTLTLRIANHDDNIANNCKWHLLSMGASAVSFESQFEALRKITSGSVSGQLRSILYNDDTETVVTTSHDCALTETALLSQLNTSQRTAVEGAMRNNMTLIQGPPGTGKTHVAAAIVEQYLNYHTDCKILLSAYSNIAVDVLTERMSSHNLRPLRIGCDSTLQCHLLSDYPFYEWAEKINQTQIICATSIGTGNDLQSKSANHLPHFLDTQYRMHPILAEFPSIYFYNGDLLTGITAADRSLPVGFDWPVADFPIAFVQTCDDAKEAQAYTSTINEREAEIVADIVMKLVDNENEQRVTVISPYSAQKKLIQSSLEESLSYQQRKRVKVRTVDGFQGSECDVIVFSATRSNDDSAVGFLSDYRRLNVMLTRCKNGLIVVGDANTLSSGDALWRNWLQYVCDANKAIVTDYK